MQLTPHIDPHPAIIGRTVEASQPPIGSHDKVVEVFGDFVRDFVGGLYHRAYVPITSIDLQDARYQHAEGDLTQPKFPNGYPIISVYFNTVMVAAVGLTFEETECAMTHAETTGSRLLLSGVN